MRPRSLVWLLLPLLLGGAARVPWEDLTEADPCYALDTRFSTVDGHQVPYPTPTAEWARSLEGNSDPAALRRLAEARLALGDHRGALEAMRRWAEATGPEAWAELAGWAAAHQEYAAAFQAAERALPGLAPEPRRALADARIGWADLHPEQADPIALRQARAELFPGDGPALERWIRALEQAGRLREADQALAGAQALDPERRLLARSDLLADHGDLPGAFRLLDAAVTEPWSPAFRRAYAARADQAAPAAPRTWRATLERGFDPGALVRLCTYFQGRDQGGAAADLLRQVERRHDPDLDRPQWLLLARLYGELDAVPEAFRATLAAAHGGSPEAQRQDLAALARLALRAGSRPLAWGTYNDEAYRWAAAVDRTPGLWTGGIAFLLTGLDWQESFARLEDATLPERTFAVARMLTAALARRAPEDPALPGLRLAIMARHVERGEGRAALALLPDLERAGPELADQAREVALLAARLTPVPPAEELRLLRARLRLAAPDGSRPAATQEPAWNPQPADGARPWTQVPEPRRPGYLDLLNAGLTRLESLDPSHRSALDLILGELDRLPDAEELWLDLTGRLEAWNLDDQLGPRYQKALEHFQGPGLWAKAARWYARRNYQAELRRLAADVAARFRGSALFERAAADVLVALPDPPLPGNRVRMVRWADLVRLEALKRFPHSPEVVRQARELVSASAWARDFDPAQEARKPHTRVVAADALLEQRRWAVLFADPGQRETWFQGLMRAGGLEARLQAMEAQADRTPVQDLLLFEGWARLGQFERAVPAADRLARSYPGDGALAQRVLALHRSLNGLEASHLAAARALAARTAPALEDAGPLWTELGEMEEERGQPAAATAVWNAILAANPRDPARIAQLATLLWDYQHDREALAVVEAGRRELGRPRMLAFEAGVLRENQHDLDGAVREYLAAIRPEPDGAFPSLYLQDQWPLRRLAQLLGRAPAYRLVAERIRALAPGRVEDEQALAAFFNLTRVDLPDPGRIWDADDWIDAQDLPNDPLGRAQRQARREAARPGTAQAVARITDLLLAKALELTRQASGPEFLAFAEGTVLPTGQQRWSRDQALDFRDLLMARRAQLAPEEAERIRLEMDRAGFLAGAGRIGAADAVWAGLAARIDRLPEGSVKLRAEAERAGYLERTQGAGAAAQEWRRITARHPWSLGLLDDRLAFLERAGLGAEARDLLEATVPRAASGHRENLLERLARSALAADDLSRARRAVAQLLAQDGLDDGRRLTAAQLMARLSFRAAPGWNPLPLARAQAALLKPERTADLYHDLAAAADLEHRNGTGLWIEALNRRTDPQWLAAAAQSALRSGTGPALLDFFQRQRQRSPREVRWAVTVRDLRRQFHDVAGAVEAAKAAVALRPDQEPLWREAAEILVRADRVREAADFLAGWNGPRAADEGVARWRSELYARAGDGLRAQAVERAALAAFARNPRNDAKELAARRGRAALRLCQLGFPRLALGLYSAQGDGAALKGSDLPAAEQARIALLTGQFPRFLAAQAGNADLLRAAGEVLAGQGRPEHKEAVQTWLQGQLWPARRARPDDPALARWWPFIAASGLEPGLRAALAERQASVSPGPWQHDPPFRFVQAVADDLLVTSGDPPRPRFQAPELERLWARELARSGRAGELESFLEPHWQQLVTQTQGAAPLGPGDSRLPWTAWLDDPSVLRAWVRAAAARPDWVRALGGIMGERRLWDRFWLLAARHWALEPLVAALPEGPRSAWFGFWQPAPPANPVLLARQRTVQRVAGLLGRMIQGAPGAGADPLLARLRGPLTVGAVLGAEPQWLWPEFAPAQADQGQRADTGDDRILGQGVDRGREPGALWGERPGEAWYVLEALSRYRLGDPSAPWLPLEAPRQGQESQRVLLAMGLAKGLGDLPLALRIQQAFPGPALDRSRLATRLALLVAAGRRPEAEDAFRAFVRELQPRLTEADGQWLAAQARDQGLPLPQACLDPGRPVGPVFLAWLQDQDPALARRLHTLDPLNYRTALAQRWEPKVDRLAAGQIRIWLRDLWATGSAGLPRAGLARLGPAWFQAAGWLESIPPPERPAALAALDQALDRSVAHPALLAQLTRPEAEDDRRLLALRIRLARGEPEPALALLDGLLASLASGSGLALPTPYPDPAAPSSADREEPGEAGPEPVRDPVAGRLETWLRPFRDARQAQPAEQRVRAYLAGRLGQGSLSADLWRLAFQLSPGAPGLARQLDAAWFRGEIRPAELGTILDTAAGTVDARLWLARWPASGSFQDVQRRVAILVRLGQPQEAARVLLAARQANLWSAREEVLAFDLWRRLGTADGPAYWTGARTAVGGDLAARLRAHPHDLLAARSAVASLAPAGADAMARAALVLSQDRPWAWAGLDTDLAILRLRTLRSAGAGTEDWDAGRWLPALVARNFEPQAIDLALADLVRAAARSGDLPGAQATLALLLERGAAGTAALRADLVAAGKGRAPGYRLVKDRPAPIRPRDLTWGLLARVLHQEGVQ